MISKGYLKLSDADMLQYYFKQHEHDEKSRNLQTGDRGIGVQAGPHESVSLFVAQKTNVLSRLKRPTCNFCGIVCSFIWYMKKAVTTQSLLSRQLKEHETLQAMGESDSLHNTLKELTSSYIVCKECFDLGNFPKVFSPDDFSAMTMKSVFSENRQLDKSNEASEAIPQNDMYNEDEEKPKFDSESR